MNQSWQPICKLFASGHGRQRLSNFGSQQVAGIIDMLLGTASAAGPRPVVVIDISRQGNKGIWSEELQRRILGKLLNILVSQATSSLSTGQSANVLVLLDEAHRHAPSGRIDEDSEGDRCARYYDEPSARRESTVSGGSSSARRWAASITKSCSNFGYWHLVSVWQWEQNLIGFAILPAGTRGRWNCTNRFAIRRAFLAAISRSSPSWQLAPFLPWRSPESHFSSRRLLIHNSFFKRTTWTTSCFDAATDPSVAAI